jgi:tetratricopeptide (TPR) repeat protein
MGRLRVPIRFLIAFLILLQIGSPGLLAPHEVAIRGDYATALRIHPDDAALLELWATALLKQGQDENAVLLLRRAGMLAGWDVKRRALLEQALGVSVPLTQTPDTLRRALRQVLAQRNWHAAQSLSAQLVTLLPQDGEALYILAMLTAPDDLEKALGWFTRAAGDPQWGTEMNTAITALAQAPDRVSKLRSLGTLLVAGERWSLAEYVLNRVFSLDGGQAGTLALLALAQESQGRDGTAALTIALYQQPNNPTVNYVAAVHWRRAGDLDRALAALGQAEASDPNNPAIPAEIATIYRQQAKPDEAASFYSLAVRLAPNEVGFYRLQCAFFADENFQLEGAGDQAIRQARARFPNDAELTAIFGQMRYRVGQLGEAKAALDRALELDPENLRARFYNGQVAQQQGDSVAARAAYERVIARAPDSTFADLAARALVDLP